jgi:hypothetical protein
LHTLSRQTGRKKFHRDRADRLHRHGLTVAGDLVARRHGLTVAGDGWHPHPPGPLEMAGWQEMGPLPLTAPPPPFFWCVGWRWPDGRRWGLCRRWTPPPVDRAGPASGRQRPLPAVATAADAHRHCCFGPPRLLRPTTPADSSPPPPCPALPPPVDCAG